VLTEHFGVPLCYAVGVTDIDDKILKKAAALQVSPQAVARNFEARFFADMATLGVREPHARLRVSEHMADIIAYVEGIIAQGFGYDASDGSVYFNVQAFGPQHYGRFGRALAARADGSGVEADRAQTATSDPDGGGGGEGEDSRGGDGIDGEGSSATAGGKRDPRDFALWKATPAAASEPPRAWEGRGAWGSPWGVGRPGWHIECSALTHAHFGPTLQLHSGTQAQ